MTEPRPAIADLDLLDPEEADLYRDLVDGTLGPSVYLLDIDACGFVGLTGAGVFDDVEEAAAAWRDQVGVSAEGLTPAPATAESLACLVYCEHEEEDVRGDESRTLMDNWFRGARRMRDIHEALRERGMVLPEYSPRYHDIDVAPMADPFAEWYSQRHGHQPDREAVEALAEEWLEGMLPGTEHSVSPHRSEHFRELIADWRDDPVTEMVLTLLPEWVRWNGEQAGVPRSLDRARGRGRVGRSRRDHPPRPTPLRVRSGLKRFRGNASAQSASAGRPAKGCPNITNSRSARPVPVSGDPLPPSRRRFRQRQIENGNRLPVLAPDTRRRDPVRREADALDGDGDTKHCSLERHRQLLFENAEEPSYLLLFVMGVDDGLGDHLVQLRLAWLRHGRKRRAHAAPPAVGVDLTACQR